MIERFDLYLHHNAEQMTMDRCDSGGKTGLPPILIAVALVCDDMAEHKTIMGYVR